MRRSTPAERSGAHPKLADARLAKHLLHYAYAKSEMDEAAASSATLVRAFELGAMHGAESAFGAVEMWAMEFIATYETRIRVQRAERAGRSEASA